MDLYEIFPINGTFYNGNIGENNQFILDFPKIFPFNGVPFNGVRLYFRCQKISVKLKSPFLGIVLNIIHTTILFGTPAIICSNHAVRLFFTGDTE